MKLVILSVALVFSLVDAELKGDRITEILNQILSNYDSRVRPNSGEFATMVTLSGYAIQVGGYCGKNDDMNVDMYFKQSWNDPRLVLPLKPEEKGEKVRLGHVFDTSKIWTPDTMFPSSRKASRVVLMNRNHWIEIDGNGNVTTSERIQVQAKCGDGSKVWNLDETRTCVIDIGSYGFDSSAIDYKWNDGAEYSVESTLHPYNVTKFSTPVTMVTEGPLNYTQTSVRFEIVKLANRIATMSDRE